VTKPPELWATPQVVSTQAVDDVLCSVIVPVYQHENFIAECLESVLAQSGPRLELLLVDDGSTDRSYAVAQELLTRPGNPAKFQRIVCETKRVNRGAHDSINRGLALARGDFIAIINSDDLFAPQRLQRMIGQMLAHGSNFAYSAVSPFSQAPRTPQDDLLAQLHFIDITAAQLPSRSFAYLGKNCAWTTGNFVMRRPFAEKVGEFAPLKLTHDWDYLLRATIFEEPLFVPERLYHYRLHQANSFSTLQNRAQAESRACISRYLQQLVAAPPPNSKCPNPFDWPGVFEQHLRIWGWENLWWQIAHGHQPYGRTERPRSLRRALRV
jgi:glycosyltransferase involved in cell wall biosynthesis